MYARFVCSCLSLCIVHKYVCLCSSMFVCSFFFWSRFLYVNPILFSTLQRQNLQPGKPHSSLALSSTAAMVGYFLLMSKACTGQRMASLSKVSGFIRIIQDAVYLLTGVRSWPSRARCSLWMSRTVLSESPVASAVHFVTAILLLVDLHAFSSKTAWAFSTICLVNALSLMPYLPGVRATLCSNELLKLPAPSVYLLFGPFPKYYV